MNVWEHFSSCSEVKALSYIMTYLLTSPPCIKLTLVKFRIITSC